MFNYQAVCSKSHPLHKKMHRLSAEQYTTYFMTDRSLFPVLEDIHVLTLVSPTACRQIGTKYNEVVSRANIVGV